MLSLTFICGDPVNNYYLSLQKLQNQSDQSSSSHAKKKEESNKKARGGLSTESNLSESIPYSATNNVVVMEHIVGENNANGSTLTGRVSVEELAKNRGDAMLRYKEKKKSRRYISFLYEGNSVCTN